MFSLNTPVAPNRVVPEKVEQSKRQTELAISFFADDSPL
jgi:hypothetical protein